jgi:hypothetical protein
MKFWHLAIVALMNKYSTLAIGLLVLCGCARIDPADIVGTYARQVPGTSERLHVMADGTFEQTVNYADGATFTLQDSWTNDYRQVSFRRLYITVEMETGNTMQPPELRHMVNLKYGPDILVKSVESRYLFRKQRAEGQ